MSRNDAVLDLNADLVKSLGGGLDFDTCSGPPVTSNRVHAQAARGALNALKYQAYGDAVLQLGCY